MEFTGVWTGLEMSRYANGGEVDNKGPLGWTKDTPLRQRKAVIFGFGNVAGDAIRHLTHPRREGELPAKEIIRSVIHFASDPRVRDRLVFLEDYDINVARYMVQGVDVWLNNPRRPLEASGTSGMKAGANGALNVSILDGWWDEGYSPDLGWAIGSGETYGDPEEQDRVECEALYNLLENEIVPLFHDRDRGGLPRAWIAMMKVSIRKLGAYFNTHRMVQEYTETSYLPAHRAGSRLSANDYSAARELTASSRCRPAATSASW